MLTTLLACLCRQFCCPTHGYRSSHGGIYLTVQTVVTSLGASVGDILCFTPDGKGAAKVQLQKAPPAAVAAHTAAGAGPDVAAAAVAAAAMAAATGQLGADKLEPGESAGEPDGQEGSSADESDATVGGEERSLGSGSDFEPPRKRRRRREGSRSGGGSRPPGASPNWTGLEEGEVDEGVYSLTLPAAAFKEGGSLKIHTPGGRHGQEAAAGGAGCTGVQCAGPARSRLMHPCDGPAARSVSD